jgi:hypothetical protein
MNLREANAIGFEPAKDEIYQGFDEDEVKGLFRDLHQSIYDYNLEVCQTIDRFGDNDHACTKSRWLHGNSIMLTRA